MTKALVTGAAGFLGSHLCDRLLAGGVEVIGLDNLYTGCLANLEHLAGERRFRFVEADITKPLEEADFGGADAIFNMACPASPPHYQRDPIYTLDTNYIGVKNLCELAVGMKARILQASTSEVYGDPHVHPQVESYWGNVNSFGIRSCYDEGKRVAETLMLEYARKFGIEIKVVRIFNTYGPRMRADDGRIVSNFIMQALRGESITIYGNGSQTRSFCYVDDLVDALVRMMSSDASFVGPVNIGNPGEFSVLEAARIIIAAAQGRPRRSATAPCLPMIPVRRKPNIELARRMLDWEPRVSFEEGILRT